jgi:2-haloacid dehalogenase
MPVLENAYDAVVFDLLTALLNSWKLWNRVAGSEKAGFQWRHAYLNITYRCGAYRPYEDLIHDAARVAEISSVKANELIARWNELEPWDEVGEIVGTLTERTRVGVATNSSNALADIAVAKIGVPVSVVVTAESVGYYKPRPEPYLTAAKRLGVTPERTLFVAGSAADLPGARGVGMDVFWHNHAGLPFRDDEARPIAVSNSLKPLLDFI